MPLDYDVFEGALTLFHTYSLQNNRTVSYMQARGLLPEAYSKGFSILDIGAGQGYLPSLMDTFAETLVLLEPNPRCVEALRNKFTHVYHAPWDEFAARKLAHDFPGQFDLITMSHMLYHFQGIEDIREKISLALSLLKPEGSLLIVLNTPSAIMAKVGIGFQLAQGRVEEALVNQEIHATCHHSEFYQQVSESVAQVTMGTVETPLQDVPNEEALVHLLRMCLLNPLSNAPFEAEKIDGFIRDYLHRTYPGLTYPATIDGEDELIIVKKSGASLLSQVG